MKNLIILIAFLLVATESFAQRERPSSGRTSSSTGSNSSSSGSSSSTVSSGTRSSGSSYSSGSSSSSSSSSSGSSSYSGGSYSSGSSSSSYSYGYSRDYVNRARDRMRGKNTAPVLTDRLTDNWGKPISSGNVTGVRNYHSGRYKPVTPHKTVSVQLRGVNRFNNPSNYYRYVPRQYVYVNWIYYPTSFDYDDGYYVIDDYDYYVYQGYRHRYSDEDKCNYELVRVKDYKVMQQYYDISCKQAYDQCAVARDKLNGTSDAAQNYVCVEVVDPAFKNKDNSSVPAMSSQMSQDELDELQEFIQGKSPMQLFKLGLKGHNNCKIEKVNRNRFKGCNYLIKVKGKTYPYTNNTICSNSKNTSLEYYGCESSSQMKNAACLLSIAMLEGYCQK